MFHLMKKDKDRDKEKDVGKKEKKDKKDKKERMSQAELKSLEEMSIRRGLFQLNRGSSKRESKTKLVISHPIPIKVASNTELALTNVETERLQNAKYQDIRQTGAGISGEDVVRNELDSHRSSVKERATKFEELANPNSSMGQKKVIVPQRSTEADAFEGQQQISIQSRTTLNTKSIPKQKTNAVVHIPELVEKTFPGTLLQLPVLVAQAVPNPRELEIQRRNTGDFGFSLRRSTMLERQPDGGVCRNVVHFAEPGVGTKDRALGLVPGDKLVEINGINVESKSRDEIVEMIRQSGDSVRLKVQPISELSELNRSWLKSTEQQKDVVDVKVDTKPDSDNGQPQAVTKPIPDTPSGPQLTRSSVAESNITTTMGDTPAEEGSGKKVVKVVRRVVRRVVPAGTEEHNQLSAAAISAAAAESVLLKAKTVDEDNDDISMGLTSLMGRGRTKVHRPRIRILDRKVDTEEVKPKEEGKREETVSEEKTDVNNGPTTSNHVPSKSNPLTSPVGFIPQPKTNPVSPPTGFIPQSKPDPLAPPAGFLPQPKPNPLSPQNGLNPLPKPDPLAAPAGFLPQPKPNPLSPPTGFIPQAKPDPLAPQAGFVPQTKPDPLAPPAGFIPAPKQNPLTPPPGFIPAKKTSPVLPKQNPLTRPPGFVPVAKSDPLAPPAGFIPKPRLFSVKKPEAKETSSPSAVPSGKLSSVELPHVQSAPNEQVAGPIPSEEDYKRVRKIFSLDGDNGAKGQKCSQPKQIEDPVAILQAAHSAAAKGKTEEEIKAEKAWYNTDKVWLIHKDGFSLATLLKTEAGSLPEGKVKIRLESDGSLLDVDEDDVEKANPPLFDRVEDLASLQYLNESSVMHSLRQRYGSNLVHTHAGTNMVVINPISAPSMYSEKVMQMFKGCKREDTAPHIYGMAQAAYRNLLTTRQDQSIVLLGKSGSGKTTNCQHIIQYLFTIAGSTNKTFSSEKLLAVYSVLDAFGNAATCMNENASRFSHVVSLDFDQAGLVTSASIQTMLLEKMRVVRRPEGESTFNVFYYLMAGVDSTLRTELHLNHFADNNFFGIMPQTKAEDKQRGAQQFSKLQAAMKVLGISSDEQKALWLILGAIYHLGAAGATKTGRKQFARHEWAQKAAYLLGCTLEELSSSIFKHQAKGTLPRVGTIRQGSDENASADAGSKATALECLEAVACGIYSELFTIIVSLINRALKSSQHSLCSLLIVDTPGFQNPRVAKRECGTTFENLCHNYTQERLQSLFYQRSFVQELERYKEENIELSFDDTESDASLSVAVVDQTSSQTLVRTVRTDEARGLLWLMEEEALQPGGSEETLLERLFSYYGPAEGESKGHTCLLRSEKDNHFLLGHSHGTDWVEYDARGWLNLAKQNFASTNALNLLQDSQKKIISSLFMSRGGGATVLSGSIAGLENVSQLSLRRATSMRKTFTTGVAAIKKKSLCIQIKLQVDALLDMVRRSRIHFVHCILPKADAPKALSGSLFKGGEYEAQGETGDPSLMQLDVALLRAQIRGSKLLDALRIYRQGYPDHMVFSEFRRRFDVLAPHLTKKLGRNYIVKDEKRAVEELLESLDLEKSSYHMGLSRLFFRAGTLAKLEEQRDEQTKRNLTLFQAACRGYLARQAFKKRKIQDLAIRCIQKNIKKNHGVKDWPWWKLFTTVQPLIKVQLTEEQMRTKDEEIQLQKLKFEKVEKERNELRLNTDRLESRIAELLAELGDERSACESATQLLETEASERLRLERDMKDLQVKFDAMKKQVEAQEMEVIEARLLKTSELNGELEDDDDSGGEWRIKYNRAIREMDFTKKKLQQEFDDKLETEQQGKRQVERKLTDLQTDNEDAQRSVQQLKKKCQKLTGELQDTKLHLEGLQNRNHDLEKKQRKFDLEQNQAQDEVQREKSQREKLAREKDIMTGEIFNLRQQLQDKDAELYATNAKVQQLEAEMQDLSSQESKDEASLAKVKKQLRDLEAKVKDQEEELDEQAGNIQMLEQAKLRLEMEMERQRQVHSKEIEGKDEEVEEIRRSCSKKLKQMEVQLEEEYEDKQKVLRERRELESKLLIAQDQVSQKDVETEKKLKKDLKRTKVLLADAQIMLDHLKSNAPSKREIAQLKNQLEESEFTCAAAVKARKGMEIEIEDLHIQMEDVVKGKIALDEQVSRLQREKNELQSRMEEDQEDMNELMKKHKAAVAQSARDLSQISDLQAQLEESTKEKQEIQEKLHSLQSQLEFQEQSMVEKSLVSRQEAKIRELETKLEYEKTQIKRLESLVSRLKENLEKMTEERNQRITAENREKEQNKRVQRQIRDMKEEMAELSKKEGEASRKKHELEMDIESLEAANQSLQVDLKLAFKRIGDLQAAIEDEMESDDNEDLINSGEETETDSEVEDRVDGVKSWLSKNKGSSKTLSDDSSLKSTRYAANANPKEMKEGKEKMSDGTKDGKEIEQSRSVSVMSSLSYRKRSNLKDSIGGTGDESSLFNTLKEQSDIPDHAAIRKAKSKSGELQDDRRKSQADEDMDDKGSVISMAYSEATSRARKGLESRWTSRSSPEFDKESIVSSVAPSRMSTRRGMLDIDDDNKSTFSSVSRSSPRSLRRSSSWKDDRRSSSRLSLARSCGLSEFGIHADDDDDDNKSLAFGEGKTSPYSPRSASRSFSTPPQPRQTDSTFSDMSDIKLVTHKNYLDPDLEAAINEVLSFKPIKFKRSKLDDSSGDEGDDKKGSEDSRKKGEDEELACSTSSLLRSSSSAQDYRHRPSSTSRLGKDKKSKFSSSDSSSSSSSSSSDDRHSRKSSKSKKDKKSKKKSKKKLSESEDSSSSSETSESSSDSTISYKSSSSVKRAPRQAIDKEKEHSGHGKSGKKDSKKKQKKMDSVVMKYLYRPDDD